MKKRKILIVDDEPDFLELLAVRLSKAGYVVFKLSEEKQIFEKISEIMPDVLLLDIMMPGINGLEIKAKLNKDARTANIPTIFLTGKGATSDKLKGLHLGADDYITKPFNSKELVARIDTAVRKKEFYEKISMTDGLTGLWNVNFFKKELAIFFNIAQRYGKTFSLALIDIDRFKDINDTYGHAAGDFILKTFCKIAKRTLRKADVIMRYGGDEFVVIMPETDNDQARKAIERLKNAIKGKSFAFRDVKVRLTFSISTGIATYNDGIKTETQLFELADSHLYRDKKLHNYLKEANA